MKFDWIRQQEGRYPVGLCCELLGVSASGYYKARGAPPSERQAERDAVDAAVAAAFHGSYGIYGSRKVCIAIRRGGELRPCRNTVAASMRRQGLRSCVWRPKRPRTTISDPRHRKSRNLLARDFSADAPNRKWVTDITYLSVGGRWAYLAAVTDLFSRRIVGWSVADHMEVSLVMDAMREAVEARRPRGRVEHEGVLSGEGLLLHSDRGSQYTSAAFAGMLESLGVTQSMSRVGCCHDNAVAESVFGSVKAEWTDRFDYADLDEARASVGYYINWFNTQRIHQTLGDVTPVEYEEAREGGGADAPSEVPAGVVPDR